MMHGKSILNPFATPYVPLSKLSSGTREQATEKTINTSVNNDSIEKSIEHQLPEALTLDYEIPSFQNPDLYGESSSKTGPHSYSDDTIQDEFGEWNAQNEMLESLSSMFPDISVEYLTELLAANHGDLNETIDVLQQFECDDVSPSSIESAITSNNYGIDPEKASSSRTGDES